MDNSNRGPAQAESPTMDAGDWRSQLQPDSRQRIVNKIMETLKKHLPISGQEGLHELKKIAVRFEEKIYTAATSQSDYLRKISLKELTMETKSQNSIANSLPSSSPCNSEHPSDPASHSMQSQVHNQGQSIPIPLAANQNQELLSQNIQSNIPAAGVQSSSSLPFALSPGAVLTQNPIPNVVSQIPNTQNISGVSQNLVGNSMVQRVPSNIFANSQWQMQGRQQVFPQQQQQQSQNQLMYQQQLQQQLYKQKFGMQSHIQQHQQQNILQPTQLQSSQSVMQTPSAMQPPVMQSAPLPGLQQANINSSSQSGLNVLQPNINTLQSNSNIHFYMKRQQEQQMLQSQQLQQQFQQQLIQKQLLQLYQQQHQHQLHQQTKKHENQKNHQVQSMNVQGAEATVQQNNVMNLQHGSMCSLSGVPTAQQYMMNLIRPSSKLDLEQSNTLSSLQQEVVGSLQQNPVSAPQQANINTLSTQSEANLVKQKPISSMQQGQFPRHHMNHFNRTLLVSFFLMLVLLIFLLYVPCDLYSFIESLGF